MLCIHLRLAIADLLLLLGDGLRVERRLLRLRQRYVACACASFYAHAIYLGALIVGGIDLWFISRWTQGYTTNPLWLIVAIPVGATLLWIVGATVALHLAIEQRGQHSSPASRASEDV